MELIEIILSLFFLVLNAFFVLVEFAIVRARPTRFEELAESGNKIARISLEITRNLNSYLASVQLGVTIASIGLGWIAQPTVMKILKLLFSNIPFIKFYSYSISMVLAFVIVTAIHIILGEQVPKYIAISHAEKITMMFAIPFKIFYQLTYYPMLVINRSAEYIVKLLKIKNTSEEITHSEDEIRLILSQSEELGKISLSRLMMFEHLFDFGKTKVKEIMTPRNRIISVKEDISLQDFLKTIKEYKFSRYPVIDKSGNFIGFIHIKKLLLDYKCFNENNFSLKNYISKIATINENTSIEIALKFFQENTIPMLLVENSKKEVVGLITVEDIIEEITGEIRDEFEIRPRYKLHQILDKQASVMSLKSTDRFEVIKELIESLASIRKISSKEELINKIIKREKSFSTAIGHQIAIPHTRIENIKAPIIVIGKSSKGVNFPSPDNKPVKLVFLIISPFNDSSIQLNILSKISKLVSNITLRKKLLNAKNIDKIEEIFQTFEDTIPL